MKHFISLRDCSPEELTGLLDRADWLRTAWKQDRMPKSLKGLRVALWFYGNGFRNRVAFEIGAREMGASVSFIPGELGVNEPLDDVAGYLGNWFSLLVLRARRHDVLLRVASYNKIPVIDARTDKSHPCEIMGDLHYIRRQRGELDGLRVVFVGEPTNLCMSWMEAATVFPIEVTQVCPEGYELKGEILRGLKKGLRGEITITNDLDNALRNVDVIYTDCWPRASNDTENKSIETAFLPYQIAAKHLAALGEKGMFLPCPPVTRGQEVSAEAMRSSLCKNIEAKDSLLHVQNAIMELISRP